ncbi:hypothetical protein PT974_11659 [Cladobotryum mycophilum]|uniref:Uncharacterized protein n=1 Tax=Cladobotryum mycophilum TaxID=491253 RepID=A0ABR0S6P8_9HYPO
MRESCGLVQLAASCAWLYNLKKTAVVHEDTDLRTVMRGHEEQSWLCAAHNVQPPCTLYNLAPAEGAESMFNDSTGVIVVPSPLPTVSSFRKRDCTGTLFNLQDRLPVYQGTKMGIMKWLALVDFGTAYSTITKKDDWRHFVISQLPGETSLSRFPASTCVAWTYHMSPSNDIVAEFFGAELAKQSSGSSPMTRLSGQENV